MKTRISRRTAIGGLVWFQSLCVNALARDNGFGVQPPMGDTTRWREWPHVSKASVEYQSEPRGDQMCATCRLFVPGDKDNDPSYCMQVAGEVEANGWCRLWCQNSG
jgi:hypothetical protein